MSFLSFSLSLSFSHVERHAQARAHTRMGISPLQGLPGGRKTKGLAKQTLVYSGVMATAEPGQLMKRRLFTSSPATASNETVPKGYLYDVIV